jgi:putative peptidoglycan lipid II flippase|tara:strand:+ start:628 stop:2184 length:1557 start_codon:yes stop_codon:yes gene_type:complete
MGLSNKFLKVNKYLPAVSIVSLGFIFARLTGIIKTMVIADQFGTSPEIAAYWVAFRIPDLLFNLLSGATLSAAFIPIFSSVLTNDGDDEGWQLASSIINILTTLTLFFCIICILFTEDLVTLIAPGLSLNVKSLAIDLTRIMLISPIFFCISGMATGILNSKNHFLAPAIAPTVYNLTIIIGALTLTVNYGVKGLAFAVVIGSIGHLFIQLIMLKIMKMKWHPQFNIRSNNVRKIIQLALPRTIGLAANQINLIIFIIFASTISEQTINAFNYAHMFIMLPVALIGMSISIAVFPQISKLFISKQSKEFKQLVEFAIFLIIFLSIPALVGIIFLMGPIIKIIFEHGEFDSQSTALVQDIVLYFSPIIVAFSLTEIMSRVYYATMDTKTPVIATIISVLFNVLICTFFVDDFGYKAIAIAGSIASIIELSILIYFLKFRSIHLNYKKLIFETMQVIFISLLMYISIDICSSYLFKKYISSDYLQLIFTIILGVAFYFISYRIFLKEKTDRIIHFLKQEN